MGLKQECPYLLNGALLTQEQQCASIKAITQYRRRQKPVYTSEGSAARRSRQARDRAEKMRKIYGMESLPMTANHDSSQGQSPAISREQRKDDEIFHDDWEEQA